MNRILHILTGASLLAIGWAEGHTGYAAGLYDKYKIVEANGGRYYSNGYDLTKLFEDEYGWGKVRPDHFEKQEAKRREAEAKRAKARIEQFAQTNRCTQREAVDLLIVADDTGRLASERAWLYSLCDN